MEEEKRFADLGKEEALNELYKVSKYKRKPEIRFEGSGGSIYTASALLLEGMDFNLVYFPLKHLGYKSVINVTGMLYASLARPKTLQVRLGVSSKLDFPQVKEIWTGIITAAAEHGYADVDLDLAPSLNGLTIALSATGETPKLTVVRRTKPKSKDLVCVSGSLGAAYLGMQALEREFKDLEKYRMIIGDYLKPELPTGLPEHFENEEIYPSSGYWISHGLSDAVKRLARDTGLGVKIYADKIPFEGNSFELGKRLDIDPVSAAFNGGDDCRLLFTIPILQLEKFRREFQAFDIIGHLAQEEVGAVLVTPEGVELPIHAQGWKDSCLDANTSNL